jgi:hypothetical protein
MSSFWVVGLNAAKVGDCSMASGALSRLFLCHYDPVVYAKPLQHDRALASMRESPLASDREIARSLGISNKTVSRWRADAGIPRELPAGGLRTVEVVTRCHQAGARVTHRRLLRWLEVGLLPSWAGVRVHPGRGSETYWWPGIVEHAITVDRLLCRRRSVSAVVLALVADGREIDEKVARGAYLAHLQAMRKQGLLLSGSRASVPARDALRRRSLRGTRLWLNLIRSERGLESLSAEARRNRELELPGPTYINDVLGDQLEAANRIFRGALTGWHGRDDFLNALRDPPPPGLLDELHSRLALKTLKHVVRVADITALREAARALGSVFLRVSDHVLERAETDGFNLFGDLDQTRKRQALYRELVLDDPLTTAELAPFFLSIADGPELDSILQPLLFEVALRYPDWRAMRLTLVTWPTLAWGDWRAGVEAG